MHQILNTLYVMTQGAYLHLDYDTVKVEVKSPSSCPPEERAEETKMQVPLHHLGGITCFGDVSLSSGLLARCAEDGRAVVLLDYNGRFKARLEGPVSGNVLLRRAQHAALSDPAMPVSIARNIVAGKIQNSRFVVMRGMRDAKGSEDVLALEETAKALASILPRLSKAKGLDEVRGLEGEAAKAYFDSFDRMVRRDEREAFPFAGRSRRPPRDRMNALLSFLYVLILSDCVAGVEGVGLDPQVGFLHALRPGRPALGLDLMEELRSVVADRLALTLVNRQQVTFEDFEEKPGGAVHLNEKGRKETVVAYQKRKQDEVEHTVLNQKVPLGLVPHLQARLLARHLRGELPDYLPFLYRA